MNSNAFRIGLAAAAVVLLAIAGVYLSGWPNVGGPSEATPSPSPAATPVASGAAAPIGVAPTGPLDPGTYLMPREIGGVAFTFTVPSGWADDSDAFVHKNTNSASLLEITTGVMLSAWKVDQVFADACVGDGTEEPVDDTAEALATALANQVGRRTRGPAPGLVFDGHPVLHVTQYAPGDLSDCGGSLRVWPGLNGDLNSGWPAGPGQTDDIYIVDVDGTRLVLVATYWGGTSVADRQELDQVLFSIRMP